MERRWETAGEAGGEGVRVLENVGVGKRRSRKSGTGSAEKRHRLSTALTEEELMGCGKGVG